jgi:hypothetical protein
MIEGLLIPALFFVLGFWAGFDRTGWKRIALYLASHTVEFDSFRHMAVHPRSKHATERVLAQAREELRLR